MHHSRSVHDLSALLICLFIAVALSITYGYNSASFSFAHANTESTFKSFSRGFEAYVADMPGAWRPRLFSNYIASSIMPWQAKDDDFALRVGGWNACWFLLCCCAYAIGDRKNALFLIFGTFGALYYAFTPESGIRIYPWDLPPLFFFVLLYIGVRIRRPLLVIPAVIVGTGFKETVALGSLVFLFWDELPVRKRLEYTAVCAAGAAGVKIAIDILTSNPTWGFTMEWGVYGPLVGRGTSDLGIVLLYNFKALATPTLNHPIFVNAGTFVVFLLLPVRDREDLMWKVLGVLFLVGILLFAIVNEYRVFFEVIPFSLYAIKKTLDGNWSTTHSPGQQGSIAGR
ncbi:MAG: hypothetical protein HY914_13540 [Desulfomonile tiedjei]|nr:hypothetical protein [Desulfomonile tiedjei]